MSDAVVEAVSKLLVELNSAANTSGGLTSERLFGKVRIIFVSAEKAGLIPEKAKALVILLSALCKRISDGGGSPQVSGDSLPINEVISVLQAALEIANLSSVAAPNFEEGLSSVLQLIGLDPSTFSKQGKLSPTTMQKPPPLDNFLMWRKLLRSLRLLTTAEVSAGLHKLRCDVEALLLANEKKSTSCEKHVVSWLHKLKSILVGDAAEPKCWDDLNAIEKDAHDAYERNHKPYTSLRELFQATRELLLCGLKVSRGNKLAASTFFRLIVTTPLLSQFFGASILDLLFKERSASVTVVAKSSHTLPDEVARPLLQIDDTELLPLAPLRDFATIDYINGCPHNFGFQLSDISVIFQKFLLAEANYLGARNDDVLSSSCRSSAETIRSELTRSLLAVPSLTRPESQEQQLDATDELIVNSLVSDFMNNRLFKQATTSALGDAVSFVHDIDDLFPRSKDAQIITLRSALLNLAKTELETVEGDDDELSITVLVTAGLRETPPGTSITEEEVLRNETVRLLRRVGVALMKDDASRKDFCSMIRSRITKSESSSSGVGNFILEEEFVKCLEQPTMRSLSAPHCKPSPTDVELAFKTLAICCSSTCPPIITNLVFLLLLRWRMPSGVTRSRVGDLFSALLKSECSSLLNLWHVAVGNVYQGAAASKFVFQLIRRKGCRAQLAPSLLSLCLAANGLCASGTEFVIRMLFERRYKLAWDTYVKEVEPDIVARLKGTASHHNGIGQENYKLSSGSDSVSYVSGILRLLEGGEEQRARYRDASNNPAQLLNTQTKATKPSDCFDEKMVNFCHAVCQQTPEKIHRGGIRVAEQLLDSSSSSSSPSLLAVAFGTVFSATWVMASSAGRPIDKVISGVGVLLRGAVQFLWSCSDGSARGPSILLLYLADLVEAVRSEDTLPLPRALRDNHGSLHVIRSLSSGTSGGLKHLQGAVEASGELLIFLGVLPDSIRKKKSISPASSSATENAWTSLSNAVEAETRAESLLVEGLCLAVTLCLDGSRGLALMSHAIETDSESDDSDFAFLNPRRATGKGDGSNSKPIIGVEVEKWISSLRHELKHLFLVLQDPTKVPGEKISAVLDVLPSKAGHGAAGSVLAQVRQVMGLLVDCVSGNFSSLPSLLNLVGAPLPPDIEETAVLCLNVLTRLSDVAGSGMSVQSAAAVGSRLVVDKLINELFDQVDADHQGFISQQRFVSLANYIGIPMSSSEAKAMFDQFDTSHDGTIDRREFRTAIELLKQKVMDRIVSRLHLQPGQILVYVLVILTILGFFLTFILLGTSVFSDGAVFTAVIGGVMPMSAKAAGFLSGGASSVANEAERILDSLL